MLGSAAIVLIAAPVSAETLRDALVKAYNTNPTLSAERANVRAIDETVPIARAAGLPSADLNSGYSEAEKGGNKTPSATFFPQ